MSGLIRVVLHINFHTRDDLPWITLEREAELVPFVAKLLQGVDCKLIQGGAASNHIHLLLEMSPALSIQELVRRIKGASSHWIHRRWPELKEEGWQNGYAVHSVHPDGWDTVARYIQRQREHHGKAGLGEASGVLPHRGDASQSLDEAVD